MTLDEISLFDDASSLLLFSFAIVETIPQSCVRYLSVLCLHERILIFVDIAFQKSNDEEETFVTQSKHDWNIN